MNLRRKAVFRDNLSESYNFVKIVSMENQSEPSSAKPYTELKAFWTISTLIFGVPQGLSLMEGVDTTCPSSMTSQEECRSIS